MEDNRALGSIVLSVTGTVLGGVKGVGFVGRDLLSLEELLGSSSMVSCRRIGFTCNLQQYCSGIQCQFTASDAEIEKLNPQVN